MLAEIANALFVTYLATEYGTVGTSSSSTRRSKTRHSSPLHRLDEDRYNVGSAATNGISNKLVRVVAIGLVVAVVNIGDDIVGIGVLYHGLADIFVWLHIPKAIIIVPTAYLTALYYDCRASVARIQRANSTSSSISNSKNSLNVKLPVASELVPRVARLFVRILPIYPIGAVLISFGFMFVISLFDLLHLPEEILNWPIYYGTLYGPFSYIYYVTKRDVLRESLASSILPMSSTAT